MAQMEEKDITIFPENIKFNAFNHYPNIPMLNWGPNTGIE